MAAFLHGVEVQEIDSGTRVIRTAKSSVIGIIGTAPDADVSAFPLLIAPGFSSKKEVLTAMIPIAERLKAIIVADGVNTNDTEAISYASEFDSSRVYIVDPWIKVGDKILPPSPFVAGLIAKSDNEKGFWHSPSNQQILGITGLSRPIDFSFGDSNCSANLLNENNVTTIIHQGGSTAGTGYRLWGNRTTSSDSKWAFLSVRRTADIINDSLLKAHLWAVDRNITRTYLEDVSESVNAYLATLKAQGAILGGNCQAPRDINSAANIQYGKVYFDFEFTPPYPAESITFRSYLTNDYINEVI